MFNIQEEQNGKRSRNPSTSSGYGGFRIGGYRRRRASEGDEGAGVRGAGGARSRGSSRHNSGQARPAYKGRHSEGQGGQGGEWIVSGSYQEKLSARLSGQEQGLGRSNPSGPRKRANSASEKVVTLTRAADKTKMMQPEP